MIGAPLAADLLDAAALRDGDRVLDVACGTGVATRFAAKGVGEAGAVVGLDSSPVMLAVASTIPCDGAQIAWREADAASTGLADDTFDAVLCQMGLQFFADRVGALQELRRVLRPGGRLALNVPGPEPELFAALEDALAEHVSGQAAGFVSTVFSLAEARELETLLADAGFDEILVAEHPKALRLPGPLDFFWQYVSSTPLARAVVQLGRPGAVTLARDVVRRWQRFASGGAMAIELRVLVVTARA